LEKLEGLYLPRNQANGMLLLEILLHILDKGERIMKPEILTHPNIPKPLHSMNPRNILGQEWWDKTRFEAQKRTNYTCSACGVKKTEAKKHQWLEGHEFFDIDYSTGRCEVISIEPLCHYCHSFIHSGRLKMIMGKDKSMQEVIEILEHGFNILNKNNLKAFPGTYDFAKRIGANTFEVEPYEIKGNADWQDYVLILEGKEYKSKFKTVADWQEYYK